MPEAEPQFNYEGPEVDPEEADIQEIDQRQKKAEELGLPPGASWKEISESTLDKLNAKEGGEQLPDERDKYRKENAAMFGLPEDATWQQIREVAREKSDAETGHDLRRAEYLLGDQYNPYEVSDIFSYFKLEEGDKMLDDLARRLEGASEDEKSSIRKEWIKENAEKASATTNPES